MKFEFIIYLFILIFSSFLSSCIGNAGKDNITCDEKKCAINGHCRMVNDKAYCVCDLGYVSTDENKCIKPEDVKEAYLFVTGETRTIIEKDDGKTQRGLQRAYLKEDGYIKDIRLKLNWSNNEDDNSKTWSEAKEYCEGLSLNGQTARLPTKKELLTLVDLKFYPTINPSFDYVLGESYWTSIDFIEKDSEKVYLINFLSGLITFSKKSDVNKVLCVSSSVDLSLRKPKHLSWIDENKKLPWRAASSYCDSFNEGIDRGWALPNINELYTLLDSKDLDKLNYWSSTFHSSNDGIDKIKTLNMENRTSNITDSSFELNVLCVSGGELSVYEDGAYGSIILSDSYIIPNVGTTFFIDIRSEDKRDLGFPIGAGFHVVFEYDNEDDFISDINKVLYENKKAHIILISETDKKSKAAAILLSKEGFRHVEYIVGGTKKWKLLDLLWNLD